MLHTHHVQRLLDLGCGTGNEVQRLAQRRDTVVGVDDSREAITQAARKAGSRTALLVADMATPLPFMTGSFEAVMSNVALHMFDNARTWGLLTEVRRMVQATGPVAVPCQCAGRLPLTGQAQATSPRTRPQ
jgi:ubiquinone/menaquinone biosynthesis C-methylase UbiE